MATELDEVSIPFPNCCRQKITNDQKLVDFLHHDSGQIRLIGEPYTYHLPVYHMLTTLLDGFKLLRILWAILSPHHISSRKTMEDQFKILNVSSKITLYGDSSVAKVDPKTKMHGTDDDHQQTSK